MNRIYLYFVNKHLYSWLLIGHQALTVTENYSQEVFLKHECPRNGHFFFKMQPLYLTLTFADDLELGTSSCIIMRYAFKPNGPFKYISLGVMEKC